MLNLLGSGGGRGANCRSLREVTSLEDAHAEAKGAVFGGCPGKATTTPKISVWPSQPRAARDFARSRHVRSRHSTRTWLPKSCVDTSQAQKCYFDWCEVHAIAREARGQQPKRPCLGVVRRLRVQADTTGSAATIGATTNVRRYVKADILCPKRIDQRLRNQLESKAPHGSQLREPMRSGILLQIAVQDGSRWLPQSQCMKSEFSGATPAFSRACSCQILGPQPVTFAGEACDESRRPFKIVILGEVGAFRFDVACALLHLTSTGGACGQDIVVAAVRLENFQRT